MMDSAILYSVYAAVIAAVSTVSAQPEGTCKACNRCNCRLNNVEILDRLIESKIASGKPATLR